MPRILIILLLCCCFTLGCEEVPPVVTPLGMGPAPDTTRQRVLVEEFTGTRCVNCPAGSSELARLQDIYGEQMIIVAIHAGSFARPYADSREDFRTPEGDALLSFLGQPLGYPSAVINRKLFDGEFDLQLNRSLWPGYLEQELQVPARVAIRPRLNFQATTREMQLTIDLTLLTEDAPDDLRLSVMVVEDSVADYQLTPDGIDTGYVHRHNLRDMLTAATGNNLPADWRTGQTLTRSYTALLPQKWVAEQCSLVMLVHRTGDQKEVWQVAEIPIPDQ